MGWKPVVVVAVVDVAMDAVVVGVVCGVVIPWNNYVARKTTV